MIKKDYLKPTMNVVELKYKRHILVGSNGYTSGRSGSEDVDLEYDTAGGSASGAW